jgi:hypothetical protein
MNTFKFKMQAATDDASVDTSTGSDKAAAPDKPEGTEAPAIDKFAGGPVKTKFYFKKKKEKNEKGEEVVIPAPEAVEATVPMLGINEVTQILLAGSDKAKELLLEAVNTIILSQARNLVDDDVEKARAEGLPAEQLTWEFIANIPPASRRGGGIPDEVWEVFTKDYVETMVHHGKTKEKAETGAKILVKRLNPVKDNKKVVEALKGNVAMWFNNTEQKEELAQVYEYLMQRADTLLEKDEDAVLAAI